MLALSKPRPSNNSIESSSSKPTCCTNRWMLQPSSTMKATSFLGIQPMPWGNFTTLGQPEKHRKRRGGIMGFHQKTLRFGRPFNGICNYAAQPFQEGARFAGINPRTNDIDCDTTVICEVFRSMNYENIIMLPINIRHPPNTLKERLYYFKQRLLRRA